VEVTFEAVERLKELGTTESNKQLLHHVKRIGFSACMSEQTGAGLPALGVSDLWKVLKVFARSHFTEFHSTFQGQMHTTGFMFAPVGVNNALIPRTRTWTVTPWTDLAACTKCTHRVPFRTFNFQLISSFIGSFQSVEPAICWYCDRF